MLFRSSSPRVSGDLIVWENYDYQAPNWNIFMKDLSTGAVSPLANGSAAEARPAVDREKVVWEAQGSTGYDVWLAEVPDTVAPVISAMEPGEGETAACSCPIVQAAYSDNRAGIDTASANLRLDGQDVTGAASISKDGISYQPVDPLGEGPHTVTLDISDLSGNDASAQIGRASCRERV